MMPERTRHILRCVRRGESVESFASLQRDDWPKIAEWPSVQENIARWTADWSRYGPDHPDPSENLTISFCEDYWG